MTERPDPFPARGTQQWRLLEAMLEGEKITPITALIDHNVFIPAARCAELRRLGWPVRTLTVPHPNTEKFPDAKLPVYLLDEHFRLWAVNSPDGTHPLDYPGEDGRGRFTKEFLEKEAAS